MAGAAWEPTARLMALIANVNRDPRRQAAFKPGDFNPYTGRHRGGVRITADNIDLLKKVFVKD